MSPSSRGLVPGLFLALAAALGVLAANNHWLFPAQGETGVRYFVSAPALARGDPALTPWIPAGNVEPQDALDGRGRLMPDLMAGLIRRGAKPHVSALWVLAGSAGVTLLALAWVAGGAAGIPGAVVAGLMLLAAPMALETVTVLGPDVLLAALTALLLGTLTYRPRASVLHGALGAAAWLAHPAGVGLVAVAVVWPATRSDGGRSLLGRLAAGVAAAVPAVLLLAAGTLHPLLRLAGAQGWGATAAGASVSGVLSFVGAGLPSAAGLALGAALTVALAALVIGEARATPPPAADVHWSDPTAADGLAVTLRPAAALVALGALLGSWGAWTGEPLSAPWFAATIPLCALAATGVVRRARRPGARRWLAPGCLAVWILASGAGTWRTLTGLRETGRGYTSAHWVESPLIRWIDNESRPYPVMYADQPALILLQTGRPTRGIGPRGPRGPMAPVGPEGPMGPTGAIRPEGPQRTALDAFATAFAAAPGAVVLTGPGLVGADVLRGRLGLRVLVEDPFGMVLAR